MEMLQLPSSQIGEFCGPMYAALEGLQLSRAVQVAVPEFPDAMRADTNLQLLAGRIL